MKKSCLWRLVEFFEADNARLSITRLTLFLSFWPATWVIITTPEMGMFGIYLGTFAGAYVGGKSADIFIKPPTTKKGGG